MLTIKKLTIGFRFAEPAFRVGSCYGKIADEILALRFNKPFHDPDYFEKILLARDRDGLLLRGDKNGNQLNVTTEEVSFTHQRYDSHVSMDKFFSHFESLWRQVDKVLEIKAIRRIGIVAEHRVSDYKNSSSKLISTLTKYPASIHAGKFVCNFEKRFPIIENERIDLRKDDYVNVIHSFYDSEMDTEVSEKDAMNANLDVQRYFGPPIVRDYLENLAKVRKTFNEQWNVFEKELSTLGL